MKDKEIEAMGKILRAMHCLDFTQRQRVLAWANEKFLKDEPTTSDNDE